MLNINQILKRNNLIPKSYVKNGDSYIVETNKKKVIVQKHNDIYEYLNSRSFNYYPNIINDREYDIIEYVKDVSVPIEQKILDLVKIVSLLHLKTTFYKEIDEDDYKKIYEDVVNDAIYLEKYYLDIINNIDRKIYLSPSERILAINISKILSAINYSKNEINNWYQLVKVKNKSRYVIINNDLRLDNFVDSNKKYIINWDKSYFAIPVFDIYNLYKKYALDFDFESILKIYEHDYPLLDDEKKLLFVLISLPPIISDKKSEYEKCNEVYKIVNYLDKTDKLISPYYLKNTKDNK